MIDKKNITNENALLVGVVKPGDTHQKITEQLDELELLAQTAGAKVISRITQRISKINASTFIGKGKAKHMINQSKSLDVGLIVFDDELSPAQIKNYHKISENIKVIDRSGLILDIFQNNARTKEATTQVDLAYLEYLLPRLTRQWTHLERQMGGIGTRAGMGETQIEVDRRLIRTRITRLKKDLKKIEMERNTQSLQRKSEFRVSLVGYTNAGKSTLFNKLTNSEVHVENKLFATLDPTMRVMILESGMEVIISDTVGFISELPHELIASFRATLEEVHSADIIINVRDISNPDFKRHNKDVLNILETILENKDTPIINVFSKCDLFNEEELLEIDNRKNNNNFYISSYTGYGIKVLKNYIETQIIKYKQKISVSVSLSDGKTLAWLYQNGQVISRNDTSNEAKIDILLNKKELNILEANNSFLSYE